MTDPCRERVVAAIATRLAAIAGITGLAVERDRAADLSVDTSEMPRLLLHEGTETLQDDFTGEDCWTLVVAVSGYVKGTTAAAAATAAALLQAKVRAALGTAQDYTLGGLARDLRPDAEVEPVALQMEGADPAKSFALAYAVDYATVEGDPMTFAG